MSDHVAEFILIQRLIFDGIQAASAIDLGTLSTTKKMSVSLSVVMGNMQFKSIDCENMVQRILTSI